MQRAHVRPQGLFERFLMVVSAHERAFLSTPLLVLVTLELFYKFGSFDLKQVVDFLTFRK
jgi:hypothetical protein